MRVLAKVVLWRNVLTSKQTASCRALSNNCLFSSLFFSFFLFFSPCEKKGNCCCWLLNPDSRAWWENQDLLLDFFSPTISFLRRTKNDQKHHHHRPLLFIVRFVIYKRTQYTYLQNGPFDAIRFSWQANYRKQGFLQTVRVFDLRVMELRVELRLSVFLFYTVRSSSLGEIERENR